MDIVVLPLSRWDGEYSSTILSMSKILARDHRVFYIDRPFSIKDLLVDFKSHQIRRRLSQLFTGHRPTSVPLEELPNFIAVTPQLTIPTNWLPAGKLFTVLSKVNDRIVYKAVKKALKKYGSKEYIYINSFNPLYGNYFPKPFSPKLKIYHCVDDIGNSPYMDKHGVRLEAQACSEADYVLTTSSELSRLKSKDAEKVYLLPNAANTKLFNKAYEGKCVKPADMEQIPKGNKVVSYIGQLAQREDYTLLNKLCDENPDITLMMVGPFGNDFYQKYGLDKRKNVLFPGPKPLEELPAYLQYSDCCIIPFLRNTLTKSIYPLKVNEYLAAGKPVVTTPFSKDIEAFGHVASVEADHDRFIAKVREEIENDNDEKRATRKQASMGNSWEDRVAEFWNIMKKHESERG